MMAAEFVDPSTQEPDAALAKAVAAYAHQHGVVTLTCGTWGNIIRFLPPLSISDELLTEGLDIVAAGLEAAK
jgi:4-aminobutyrate aminotransferase/(S)-3-amino-2-methylpropionate transaminase